MSSTLKALSALLTYPTPELAQAAGEISEALDKDRRLPASVRDHLHRLLNEMATGDLYDLQERYVLLFDRTRSLSLHLFEHVHGESRDRGQAMIDLKSQYESAGLYMDVSELPDFLPLFLEYVATRPAVEAAESLGQPAHIFAAMAERLRKRRSPYEAVFRALVAIAAAKPTAEEVSALLSLPDPDADDLAALDAAWEDEPVNFGPGSGDGCRTISSPACAAPCDPRPTCPNARVRKETTMRDMINHIVFGWYPYLCLTVFLFGSLVRFDREQYTWRSGSSQLLRRRQLTWGSNLFHVGILAIFAGHFVGLLTPIWIFDTLGISHTFKQWMAIVIGGVAGVACFIGMTLLIHRRLFDARIRTTSSFGDIAILLILYAQLILGLSTIFVSLGHLDGHEMVKFMTWAQGILTLQPGVSSVVADVHPIFKAHLFLGMTIFLVFPFTRLVHIWSAPVWYLGRRGYQVVRTRRPMIPAE